jgi:hypothetical protein
MTARDLRAWLRVMLREAADSLHDALCPCAAAFDLGDADLLTDREVLGLAPHPRRPGTPHPCELDAPPVDVDDLPIRDGAPALGWLTDDTLLGALLGRWANAMVREWCADHAVLVHPSGALAPGAVAMWRADLRGETS